jgi:uncharacterized protein YbbK (DUF523 family)
MSGKILVSACLLGQPVRYDGRGKLFAHDWMTRWKDEGRLVSLCPEMAGGFSVPRLPAEIENGKSGADVLAGCARVLDRDGRDISDGFLAGAQTALNVAQRNGCAYALLIDGSPSCGSLQVFDGSFSGRKHAGHGVTAALLLANGIEVFAPAEIERLAGLIAS